MNYTQTMSVGRWKKSLTLTVTEQLHLMKCDKDYGLFIWYYHMSIINIYDTSTLWNKSSNVTI